MTETIGTADSVKNLTQDETFRFIIGGVRIEQTAIFLNPNSSQDDRESAHKIICGVAAIEDYAASIISNAEFSKRRQR